MLPTHAPAPNGGALEHATGMLTQEQLDLIKRTIAYGATDDELALFVHTARRLGLDPLARQIHFVKRRRRTPDGRWEDYGVIQVGIDGFRAVAERSGKYAGQLGPYWCDEYGEWRDVWLSPQPPAAAKVGVLRSDFREPIWGVARYATYVQTDAQGNPNSMWRKMPDLMLAKCAEALALRKAFPQDLSGVYAPEEMMQADSEQPPVHQVVSSHADIVLPPTQTVERSPAPQTDDTRTLGELRTTDERARTALKAIWAAANEKNMTNDDVHALASRVTGREIESCNDLTIEEARKLYRAIKQYEVAVESPRVAPPPRVTTQPPPKQQKTIDEWIAEASKHPTWSVVEHICDDNGLDVRTIVRKCYPDSLPTDIADAVIRISEYLNATDETANEVHPWQQSTRALRLQSALLSTHHQEVLR